MRASAVLSLVAGVQVVFLLLVVGLLIVSRRRVTRMDRQHQRVALQLEEPLRAWAIGERSTESLLPLLRNMPPVVALESFAVHSAACVSRAERETMARMLRREEWVHKLLALHTSRRWTRRLRAARTLVVAGVPSDRPMLATLLADTHPVVVSAALFAVGTLADAAIATDLVDRLPEQSPFLRLRMTESLHAIGSPALPTVRARLREENDPQRLRAFVELANQLADPRAIVACAAHAGHADPEVRRAVARACQHYFSERAHPVLLSLLVDAHADVRAEAARTLGAIRATACVPALAHAMRDLAHNVRVAAALALTEVGPAGRRSLASAEATDDRFAADAARLVSGLSRGAIRELMEA